MVFRGYRVRRFYFPNYSSGVTSWRILGATSACIRGLFHLLFEVIRVVHTRGARYVLIQLVLLLGFIVPTRSLCSMAFLAVKTRVIAKREWKLKHALWRAASLKIS